MEIVINGRVLGDKVSGIPRYTSEIIKEIDKLITNDNHHITLVIPSDSSYSQEFKNINIVKLPNSKLWDFFAAESFAKKNKALYVCFSSKPVLMNYSISTVHDVRMFRLPELKSQAYRKIFLKALVSCLLQLHRSKYLLTVSEFSKSEIVKMFHIKPDKISVIGNGWEHIKNIKSDYSIFNKHKNLEKGSYYIAIGSIATHKNYKWIIDNARLFPEKKFVVIGNVDVSMWNDTTDQFVNNVIYLGYQNDECMKALMENAKALVFPSLYEGFGIPPLEALAIGIPVIVSDIPVMREIFKDSVHYINIDDPNVDLDILLNKKVENSKSVLEKYSWKNSALLFMNLIERIAK